MFAYRRATKRTKVVKALQNAEHGARVEGADVESIEVDRIVDVYWIRRPCVFDGKDDRVQQHVCDMTLLSTELLKPTMLS